MSSFAPTSSGSVYLRNTRKESSLDYLYATNAPFLLQLLHDLNRNSDETTQGSCVEKGEKRAQKNRQRFLHRAANIPEPARAEIFYKGLDSSFFLPALSRTSNLPGRLLFTSGCCRRGIVQCENTELKLIFLTHFLVSNFLVDVIVASAL